MNIFLNSYAWERGNGKGLCETPRGYCEKQLSAKESIIDAADQSRISFSHSPLLAQAPARKQVLPCSGEQPTYSREDRRRQSNGSCFDNKLPPEPPPFCPVILKDLEVVQMP